MPPETVARTPLWGDVSRSEAAFFTLVALTFPAVHLASALLDQTTTVVDATGGVHTVSQGNARQLVQLVLALLAAAAGAHLILTAIRERRLQVHVWTYVGLAIPLFMILRGERDVVGVAYAALTLLFIVVAGTTRVTFSILSRVGVVTALTGIVVVAFSSINPDRGWGDCRADKCSIAGSLLRGFFVQENVLALFFAVMLPTIAAIPAAWFRRPAASLTVVLIILSGSRTGLVLLLFSLVAYILIARRRSARGHGDAAKILGIIPLICYVASLALVFLADPEAITGRGTIFHLVTESWKHHPLLGAGRDALEEAYYTGAVNWYVAHEHSQGAYLLSVGGLVGVILFAAAMATIARSCWDAKSAVPVALALSPSVGFLTEPTWEISVQSAGFVSLLLTVALCSHRTGAEVPLRDSSRDRLEVADATAPSAHR